MLGKILRSRPLVETPLPYTSSPWKLLREDIRLVFRTLWYLPAVMLPFKPSNGGDLNELYPSLSNLANLAFHAVLSLIQLFFLCSIPLCFVCMVPFPLVAAYVGFFLWANKALCNAVLNREPSVLVSNYPEKASPAHDGEHWIFINGVACGQSWLQKNIDRLGCTFGRKVTGVHNPSTGMIFDIIQCLIQRDFGYATQDVRDAYALVRASLSNSDFDRVVLIVHSQGGIEAGLITDWLLDELPQRLLRKLEIYTFGNAANHFNNPYRTLPSPRLGEIHHDPILHIEHYVNSADFIGLWGVLNFAAIPNRFMGRVFVRCGTGHLFNQHYLGTMFPLGPNRQVLDSNPFMDTIVDNPAIFVEGAIRDGIVQMGIIPRKKLKTFSRLWLYRNGGKPIDPKNKIQTFEQ
ncbi:hypothetical protein BDV06DRAFT_210955 [Aspergillus oleicola]